MTSTRTFDRLVGPRVPRPEDIQAEWMADALSAGGLDVDVAGVVGRPVGSGQLGETMRFDIDYGARRGPPTLIGKFATLDQTSRTIAGTWRLYEREVGFYRWLSADARLSLPACYGAHVDAGGEFVLLMEDCAPARPGDQMTGLSPADARHALREAARLHAAFWDRGDDADFAWLETGPLAQPFYGADILRGTWPGFRDRYADRLSAGMIRVCDRLADRYERYAAPLTRPRCVTHNDFRPDNMLFGPDGRLTVVDWQSAALGHNAVDVAYLIGGAFRPEDRRAAERDLLDAYHRELVDQGVGDYSRDALDEDYRHFSFAGINVAVGAAMLVKRTERGDQMFLTMLDRHVGHVLDTGALDILQ